MDRKKLEGFAENAAGKNDWTVNPDPDFRNSILDGLFSNYSQYGYLCCPCREAWGVRERDRDIICPCVYSREDINEHGQCFCGLFLSEEFAASGSECSSIAERRPDELQPE